MGLGRIVEIGGFGRKAEAEMIDGDATVCRPQFFDDVAVFKAPGGSTVDEEKGWAAAFVDIVKPVTIDLEIIGPEGIFRPVEPLIGHVCRLG
jgi:hypothetical protein